MKLETFFEKFDELADTPDAVAKMRKLILTLAARGQLVEQGEPEKPSSRVTKVSIHVEEPPYELPSGWVWKRLGDLADFIGGSQPPKSKFIYQAKEGYTRFVQIRDFKSDANLTFIPTALATRPFNEDDVMIGRYGPPVFQILRGLSGTYNVALMKAEPTSPSLTKDFLFYLLQEPRIQDRVIAESERTAGQSGVRKPLLSSFIIGLPPLAEQKRIVAKVDELMAMCDRLEAQQQERETRHAALARASLARFADAPTPANLPFLFHPSYAIPPADLRKSILTLAVQGKLVPQDPNDEPAAEFIATVRNAARETGYRGRSNSEDDSNPKFLAHVPDELPAGWSVCPLEDLFKFIDYRGRTPVRRSSGVRLITAKNVKKGFISNEPVEFIAEDVYPKWMTRGFPKRGDLLFVTEGHTMGFVGTLNFDFKYALAQRTIDLQPFCDGYGPFYLYYLLSEPFQTAVVSNTTGSAAQGVKAAKLKRIRVIIPPLAEQRRIVAKVEQLMAWVDALETQLAAARATAANLLSALVAELTGTPNTGKVSVHSASTTGRRGRPSKS